jgi:biotin synthase
MIGLPEQTVEDLADDIIFFKENDIDMLGMGPYIPHKETLLGQNYFCANSGELTKKYDKKQQLQLSLNMVAVTRIVLKDVNIASTTALETLDKNGRILGLQYGANVVMPQFTPNLYKANYLLYDKKPTVDESKEKILETFTVTCVNIGRKVAYDKIGTSLHYSKRQT